ncbi:NUDIX hydrolase [Streptomyces sp. ODS28]|uniref:NUDIX hydrolase n=1 Tax=Streptomyces sp. ODS28 TaxID=3136688 RepID=UPI0031E5F3CF
MTTPPEPGTPAWTAYLAEGNAKQARKRVAADVLFRDGGGRVLLVKPTYKEAWDLPGGMAEANEAPHFAALRELREELGLDVALRGVLCVDWVPPHGPWDDQLAFVFDGGVLEAERTTALRPLDRELSACGFHEPAEALERLGPRIRRRTERALEALENGTPAYLHDGLALEW